MSGRCFRAQELCESRDGRPGLPSLITYGFRGRKATLNQRTMFPVPSKPYGFCGRKAPRKKKGNVARDPVMVRVSGCCGY